MVHVKALDGLSSLASPHQNWHCQTLVGILNTEAKTSSESFTPLRLPPREYEHGARERGHESMRKRESVVSAPSTFLTTKKIPLCRPWEEDNFLVCHLFLEFYPAAEKRQLPVVNDLGNVVQWKLLLLSWLKKGLDWRIHRKENRTGKNGHEHIQN